jgi:hypothetical protein
MVGMLVENGVEGREGVRYLPHVLGYFCYRHGFGEVECEFHASPLGKEDVDGILVTSAMAYDPNAERVMTARVSH